MFSDSSAEVMEVDHDRQLVFCETLRVSSLTTLSPCRGNAGACSSNAAGLGLLGAMQPSDEQVAARLSAPVVTTQLDTRNIAFERWENEQNVHLQQTYIHRISISFSPTHTHTLVQHRAIQPEDIICLFFFSRVEKITFFWFQLSFCQCFSVAVHCLHCNPQLRHVLYSLSNCISQTAEKQQQQWEVGEEAAAGENKKSTTTTAEGDEL